ncbi:MAG TPA: T9SS type A sorting domain-containing protein, partial [Saprospiraceae bacterium]|nr:T9SS type A sorting domain-containing protein [Saprospiraceae bacterium]
ACYTFTIYDAFGDGMSAQGVKGDYDLYNSSGNIIASLSKPNFGQSDANQFCLTGQCLLHLGVGIGNESSPGLGDGWVMAEVENSLGALTYSINGGTTFQSANTFSNLAAGDYSLIVVDDAGCADTVSFSILSCNLQTFISTIPASAGDIGEIHISASGGVGHITYSLNGSTFVSDSFFVMLEPGNYVVITRDSVGCESIDTVTVSTQVSTTSIGDDNFIKVYPNPGKGVYQVNSLLNSNKIFIDYTIFNVSGEPIQHGSLAKYNEMHKGEISLVAYPPGIYYASFYVGQSIVVKRLIKIP